MQPSSLKSTGSTSPDTETYVTAEGTTWNQLTLLRAEPPARTCPSRGNGLGLRENEVPSGESSPESLASLGPDGLWRRMSSDCYQQTLDGSLETFSGTWPRSGMMLRGTCYVLPTLGHPIEERESYLLPTPTANESKGCGRLRYHGSPNFRGAKMSEGLRICADDPIYPNPLFIEKAMGFPLGWTDLETPSSPSLPNTSGD